MSQSELHRIHLPGCEYINRTPPTMNISYSGKHETCFPRGSSAFRYALVIIRTTVCLISHNATHAAHTCMSLLLTTEEEHVERLVGLQDDKVRPKHHPGSFILIVVYLHCTVAWATVRHHHGLVTFLREHQLCNITQGVHKYSR